LPEPQPPQTLRPELGEEKVPGHGHEILRRGNVTLAEERIGVEIGMVEALDDGVGDHALELRQVHDHARFRIHHPAYGHFEDIVVTVRYGEIAENTAILLGEPLGPPVAVGRREGELPRRVDEAVAHRDLMPPTTNLPRPGTAPRPVRPHRRPRRAGPPRPWR